MYLLIGAPGAKAWPWTVAILVGLLAMTCLDARAGERPKIGSAADLAQFSYPVTGTAVELLNADAGTFESFARGVRRDLETVLRDYDVQDTGVLIQLLSDE